MSSTSVSSTSVAAPAKTKPQATRAINWGRWVLWAVLAVGAFIMVFPFLWTLLASFKTPAELREIPPTFLPQQFTLENWQDLGDLDFGSFDVFFRNSLFVVGAITLATLITSSLTGYVFAKFDFIGRNALFWLVLSLMMIPFSVTLIPLFDMMVNLGWTNNYIALVVPILFNPFGIFLMRQHMQVIPQDLIDAARIDGATEYGIFFRLIVPLSSAPIAALAIFTFTVQWDNFLWPLVILDDTELWTLPLGLSQFRGRSTIEIGALSAASMLTVIPVLAVYVFAQRRFIEGIALTGMKG
jgi:multiple sugar transport system permease protein